MSHRPVSALAPAVLLALLLAGPTSGAGDPPARVPLTVRATEVVAPCLRAAVAAYPSAEHAAVSIEAGPLGPGADVLVGAAVEVTRALESGIAVVGTDVALARIPWVLTLSPAVAGPRHPADGRGGPSSAAALAGADVEVVLVGGSAAHEARRHLERLAPGRVREAGAADHGEAGVVAAPLSLAGPGERVALDVSPLEAQAALGASSPGASSAAARELLAFLTSAKGLAAFAECRAVP